MMLIFLKWTRKLALTVLHKEGWDYPIWMLITFISSFCVVFTIGIAGFSFFQIFNIPEKFIWVLSFPLLIPATFFGYSWILLLEWILVRLHRISPVLSLWREHFVRSMILRLLRGN
jgi:hypothetical protein